MSPLNYGDASDLDLVEIIRKRRPMDEQKAALVELECRCVPAFRALGRRIQDMPTFLRQAGIGAIEDLEAEAMANAIETYQAGEGTRLSSYAGKIFGNRIIDIFRRAKRPQSLADLEPEGKKIEPSVQPGVPLERDVLDQVADLTRACLEQLDQRRRDVFLWSALMEATPTALHELFPDVSTANFKQIKHRAVVEFIQAWKVKGGDKLQHMVQEVGRAMAERVDLSRIKDETSRRAVEAWRRESTLSSVAKALNIAEAEAKQLLIAGLQELARKALVRGGNPEVLAEYLEVAEEVGVRDEITIEVASTIAFVRAAFGLGPLEAALDTLGSLLQRNLRSSEDYDRAVKDLGLKPAALRALLADEGEVDPALMGKLAVFLSMPLERLERFPRRPSSATPASLRSTSTRDTDRFRERVFECLKKR